MTGIPPQDGKKYTEEEIEHILARRMAAVQLEQLTEIVSRNEAKTSEIFSDIRASLKSLHESSSSSMSHLYQCRTELYNEIEVEFVTKVIFDLEMNRIETMIKSQWKMITIAVAAVVGTMQIAFKLMGI